MPIRSVTTTASDVFFGSEKTSSINFKNGSLTGTIYLRYKPEKQNTVTSTDYEWSLTAGASVGLARSTEQGGVIGPFSAVSDTGGGVTLEIMEFFNDGKRDK